eukprot:PhF_6_TR7327/c2_g1_i1/m.11002
MQLEAQMRTCFKPEDPLFKEFRSSIQSCYMSLYMCVKPYIRYADSCPQRDEVNISASLTCYDKTRQCMYENSLNRLLAVDCEDQLVKDYMNPDLQYKDCMNDLDAEVLMVNATVQQKVSVCTDAKYMASAWQQYIQEVAFNSTLPVRNWTADM